jgi:hypothetical protein
MAAGPDVKTEISPASLITSYAQWYVRSGIIIYTDDDDKRRYRWSNSIRVNTNNPGDIGFVVSVVNDFEDCDPHGNGQLSMAYAIFPDSLGWTYAQGYEQVEK